MANAPTLPQRLDSLAMDEHYAIAPNIAIRESDFQPRFDAGDQDSLSNSEVTMEFETPDFFKESYKTLNTFLDRKEICDVEIVCGSKSFRCHRIILATISGYFRAMFLGNLAESRQDVVAIQDIDENVMADMIKYAYSGKILITVENVQSILYVSCILQVENVAKVCSEFMKRHLSAENCLQVHAFAMQHNRENLIKYTQDFITENFIDVTKTPEFLSMSSNVIDSIVGSEYLNVSNETEVFEAIMSWIKHNTADRKQHLAMLFSKIKVPLIETSYLMEKVATDDLVRLDLGCRDILDEAKYYHMYQGNLVSDIKLTDRMRPRKSYAGVLFCVGGRGASGDPYKTIECYYPMKNRWYQLTEMHTRRRHVGVCCLNDQIYAVGGHNGTKHLGSGEVFDPFTAKWRKVASMVTQRTGVRGLGLASLGGAIYAVGGLDDKTCFDTVERYDPTANSWTQVASMNLPRGGVGVAALRGQLYAIGGNDGTSSLDQCEVYDPFINKWTLLSPMTNKRAGAGVAVLDGYIYAVGGFDDNASLDTCERFDPKTGRWTMLSKLSCPRGGVGVAALGGRLYAVGGHDGQNYLNSVEAYDPLKNCWETVGHMTDHRAGAGLACCPMKISTFSYLKGAQSASGPL
ncbi:kelch-like protein 8 isoform X2 [Dreissena polymorpha]|nr:kelch-like protein 8 isoform X2 [Dreissena polymorpha]XP_052276835.1 kelch-like protein 8 isoform X2 [Dreissena polymorpha]XP_052276836.1 kelch-like protein 8 isoform X2 [Dreissena polymorpha]